MTQERRKFNSMSIPNQKKAIFTHQELKLNIRGVSISIAKDGKVTISTSSPDPKDKDSVVIDEVTVPAGLIFKLAQYLEDTRMVSYVDLNRDKKNEPINQG